MPHPENVSQLTSLLGIMNRYAKFIPELSQKCFWFHELLKKDVAWSWSKQCKKCFCQLKGESSQATHLVHFNPKLPLVLAADRSKYGLGAVLCHKMADGTVHPNAHASYGQIEEEVLAFVSGVKKFQHYLAGRDFILLTHHKPLVTIFCFRKGTPQVTVNRF